MSIAKLNVSFYKVFSFFLFYDPNSLIFATGLIRLPQERDGGAGEARGGGRLQSGGADGGCAGGGRPSAGHRQPLHAALAPEVTHIYEGSSGGSVPDHDAN